MIDSRVQNLARILVHYCVRAQPKELIQVRTTTEALALVDEIHDELMRAGAWPLIQLSSARMQEGFFRYGQDHHLDELTALDRSVARTIAGTMRISASANTHSLSSVDPKKQVRYAKATKPMRKQLIKKKWVVSLFPTQAHAQDADMSLSEFEDFVYAATFADQSDPIRCWKNLKVKQDKLIAKFKGADEVRIQGPDTDLRMSVKDRIFINSPGIYNMPSGEIFTGPIENSVNGHIRYDFPVCEGGREVDGIRLVFRDGKVVEASADKNEEYLLSMLDLDPGARRLGELGIGTNFGIQRFIKNILYDEKIGGTIHLALGSSYEETGGKNQSALHWDMIKDLRKGGSLSINGKVVQRDGKFARGYF